MARPRTFDETEVLDRAVQLFWTHGYDGTSIADLEAATGLGRQSLYNTFGGKRELFVRALKHYHAQAADGRAKVEGAGLDALSGFLGSTIGFMSETGERRGCFLTKARLESADAEGVQPVCQLSESSIRRFIEGHLVEARESGELRDGVVPHVAAGMLATWLHGLSAASAAGAEPNDLQREARLIIDGLRAWEAPDS